MKILCNAAVNSDLQLLSKLSRTDTWIKASIGSRSRNVYYINILRLFFDSEGAYSRAYVRYIPARYVDGDVISDSFAGSMWFSSLVNAEMYSLSDIHVIHPIETMSDWELRSALEFADNVKRTTSYDDEDMEE